LSATSPASILARSTRLRTTPYTPRLEAAGVKAYTVYNHTLLPMVLRSAEDDYWQLHRQVQLWDVTCRRPVELHGSDAAKLAQLLTPRDLSRMLPGRYRYAPMLDEAGGLINDPVVIKLAEDRFWLSLADSDVLLWAQGLALGLGLEVSVREAGVHPLAVQGPQAPALVAARLGPTLAHLPTGHATYIRLQNARILAVRNAHPRFGGGFELYPDDPSLALQLWDALWTAGAAFEIGVGGPSTIARVEASRPAYGEDFDRSHNLLEAGLERFCDLRAPIRFVGRRALLGIKLRGVQRVLRGLRFGKRPLGQAAAAWPVHVDGAEVARATSVVWSPALRRNLAFAILPLAHAAHGTVVDVVGLAGSARGRVFSLPFELPPA
jgi:dimethylsulfoniopropionate demethylase